MFSQSTDYALRCVVCLAMHDGRSMTNEEIAEITRVPAPYLAKLIKALHNASLVTSKRGVNGGTRLAKPTNSITVLHIVQAVDPLALARIDYCPLGLASHGVKLCSMHHKLDEAMASIEKILGETSILALLQEKREVQPLCETMAK